MLKFLEFPSQQGLELVQPRYKKPEGAFNRSRGRHIHSGRSQSLERKFRSARTQETKVGLRSGRAGKNAFRESDCGRNPSRIFINIEGAIKVGDAQTFESQLGIDDEVRAEVYFEKLAVFFFENIERESLA
jgi:hypothetical protein